MLADTAGAAKAAPRMDQASSKKELADALAIAVSAPVMRNCGNCLTRTPRSFPFWPTLTRADDPLQPGPDGTETNTTLPGTDSVLHITNVVRPTLAVMRPRIPMAGR